MRTGSKDAFGNGLGNAHQFGLAMGERGITPAMFQQAVANPARGAAVATALRGDGFVQTMLYDLIGREKHVMEAFYGIAGLGNPNNAEIEKAVTMIGGVRGVVSENDRYIPGGLDLEKIMLFFYGWNRRAEKESAPSLKLYHEANKEWWRTDKSVESIPTEAGIITCDFQNVMKSTDLAGRPFYLNTDEQTEWTKEQGGNGLTSAEQVVYLFARSLIECHLPLWGCGSIRCKNTYGSASSLVVSWNADNGFCIGYWKRSDQDWDLGALPRKSLVLVP